MAAPEPLSRRAERAADILQARLSWPDAERYAAELDQAGVLESGDESAGIAVLTNHLPRYRAEALIRDLRMCDVMVKPGG